MERMEAATLAAWMVWALDHWPGDDAAMDGHRRALLLVAAALERLLAGEDVGPVQ